MTIVQERKGTLAMSKHLRDIEDQEMIEAFNRSWREMQQEEADLLELEDE